MPMYDYEDRYVDCNECGGSINREYDDFRTISSECGCCDSYLCYSCDRQRRYRGTLRNYGYKPSPYKPKGNYPTEVLMGVELEVGGDSDEIVNAVNSVDSTEDHLYCKSDCSIHGAEIVTHPMTLAWAKESGLFPPLLAKLRDEGCFVDKEVCTDEDNDKGCQAGWSSSGRAYCDHSYGLHIHVSRNAFRQARKRKQRDPYALPPLNESYEDSIKREMREMRREQKEQQAINHQMIWLMFLERNSDKLNGATKLARRDSSQYGAFKKSTLQELQRKGTDMPYTSEARYTAINCMNEKTYELRFFKSTIDEQEFFAALEFADASVEFTRNLNATDVLRNRSLEWSNFVEWVNSQEIDGVRKYPNLSAQISTLSLV